MIGPQDIAARAEAAEKGWSYESPQLEDEVRAIYDRMAKSNAMLTDANRVTSSRAVSLTRRAATGMLVTPQQFGATADGVTDDGWAIQAALDHLKARGGGELYFPAGTYAVVGSRLIYSSKDPITITGAGWCSKLVWTEPTDDPATDKGMVNISGVGAADADHITGVVVRDLFIDFGNTRDSTHIEGRRGINIYNADNILVEHCRLKGCRGETIGLGNFGSPTTPGRVAFVLNCRIEDFVQDGCNPNVYDATVRGCMFLTGNGMGVEAGRDRFICEGNHFEDIRSTGVNIASCTNFVVRGNRFRDCSSVFLDANIRGSVYVVDNGASFGSFDGIIADNVIVNTSQNAWQTGIATQSSPTATESERIIISGNLISGPQQGIYLMDLKNSQIFGNTVIAGASSSTAIVLVNSTTVTDNTVWGNTVLGAWSNVDYENLGGAARNNLMVAHLWGSGAPALDARVGSVYTNLSGGAGTTLYVKESNTTTAGWAAK